MNIFNKVNKLTAWSNIQMKADKTAELNISGYIGIPEWWQFDPDMEKDLISTKEKMQAELKEISNIKAETIKVNIDSLGGDVNHGQAMYSALAKNPAKIIVEYTGWSASIATIIAAAATDNDISMSNTNMILIHKARGCQCGISEDMRLYADMLDKVDGVMANVYSEQTGKTKAEMLEQMNVNKGDGEWLTANEALEIGLIGNITEPLKAAANYDLSRLSKFGYKIPQNKLNNINMKFVKDKPINALAMQDGSILLHEGELKEGSELKTAGENVALEAGEYPLADGRKIVIGDDNKVASIEAKVDENADESQNEIVNAVAEMLVELEAKFDKKLEDLRSKGSKAQVPKVGLKDDEKIDGTQATARSGIQARMKKIAEEKRKNRSKD